MFQTAGTTTITDFDEGRIGQTIKVRARNSITIQTNSAVILNGGTDFAMTFGDTLTLTMYEDGLWSEDSRSDN